MPPARNSRKTIAERFGEDNRSLINSAEMEVSTRTSIADLMHLVKDGGAFRDILNLGPEKKAWATISRSRLVELLREVADKGNSEAFKHVLSRLLRLWEITPPPNTFTHWKGEPGAPVKRKTQQIRIHWEQEGKPRITNQLCLAYAKRFYASEYAKARGPQSRRKLIARIRTPLLKHQNALAATNSVTSNS